MQEDEIFEQLNQEIICKSANTSFIWCTILSGWLISLCPERLYWISTYAILPSVLIFWNIYGLSRINCFVIFIFGILMDVHRISPLGSEAFFYLLLGYLSLIFKGRIIRSNLLTQIFYLSIIFFISKLLSYTLNMLLWGRSWDFRWMIDILPGIILWPILVHWLQYRELNLNSG